MSALFGKNKKKNDKAKEEPKLKVEETKEQVMEDSEPASLGFVGKGGHETYRVLKGFYVSEKSSIGAAYNQYVFRVFKKANKTEVKKEVSKLFNVQVKSVKILNMPEKRRDFGKHPGERSGYKKAVVVLKEGFVIGQAKP